MAAMKDFVKTTTVGGVIVVLPVAILVAVFAWVWGKISGVIEPLVVLLLQSTVGEPEDGDNALLYVVVAQIVVLLVIVAICFALGLGVKTAFGNFLHRTVEDRMLRRLPGYSLVKETVLQFLGDRESPFSSVAMCQIFGNDTLVTGFVTDKHENGMVTVFIPTGPNPTSGNIYHLKPEYVYPISLPVEDVMRSIISCGAGSASLIKQYEGQLAGGAPVDAPPALAQGDEAAPSESAG